MENNILFVSKLYPEEQFARFQNGAKIGLDFAAHNLSMAIWAGLKENGVEADLLNTPQLGSWPLFHKTPFISGWKGEHIISVPYLNIMYFKRRSLESHIYNEMKLWCERHTGRKSILLYNFNYIRVAKRIKALYPDVKFCLLVTDLPQYMATKKGLFTTILNKTSRLQDKDFASQYDSIDGFVLLAKDMKDRLPIIGKRWIQIEGIYNSEVSLDKVKKDANKVVMYTGNLGSRYGIPDLLKAFMMIDNPNYRLWIRGDGECESLVKEYEKKDRRIVYLDRLPRKELLNMQQQATVLVNPVHSFEEFSHYFFPSKTLEYLASGTPTLMNRLSCMPKEYDEYLFYFEDESVEGMAKRIQEVCELPEDILMTFGEKSANFIRKCKTPKPQMKIVLNFIEIL